MEEMENIIVLTDQDGNEIEFRHLDTFDYNNETYVVLIDVQTSGEENDEIVILKVSEDENGEDVLVNIDDDDELDDAFQAFLEKMDELLDDDDFDDDFDEDFDEEDPEDEDDSDE